MVAKISTVDVVAMLRERGMIEKNVEVAFHKRNGCRGDALRKSATKRLAGVGAAPLFLLLEYYYPFLRKPTTRNTHLLLNNLSRRVGRRRITLSW